MKRSLPKCIAAVALTTRWSSPLRISSKSGDSTPTIAIDSSGRNHVVFRRMATTAGLYALSWTSGLATATRISGTTANDRAPVLSTRGTTARVAFARTGGSGGIFLATRGSSWGAAAQQSTSGTGDALPALVTDAGNHVHLAYDRN